MVRIVGAFVAAVGVAAIIFDLEFVCEGMLAGESFTAALLSVFAFLWAVSMALGLATALLGGVPVWLIFRQRGVHSVWAFAVAGALLALLTYILLVAAGMGEGSDRPMTFAENLGQPMHLPRMGFAVFAGAVGAVVFRRISGGGQANAELVGDGRS